jgi:hypothetical protein
MNAFMTKPVRFRKTANTVPNATFGNAVTIAIRVWKEIAVIPEGIFHSCSVHWFVPSLNLLVRDSCFV